MRALTMVLVALSIGCSPPSKTVTEEESDCLRGVFAEIALDYEAVASLKEACGWIEEPMDYLACTKAPDGMQFSKIAGCEDVWYAKRGVDEWLRMAAPEFAIACKQDSNCVQWHANYISHHGGEPAWW